ncbi:MAG TPA: hypothetical protein VGO93_11575 [Candidatus Xenobia bacterium]|jgi:hypothetical protein
MKASDCPNTDYAQLAALGRYYDTHKGETARPLTPAAVQTPRDPVDHVDASECPNSDYAQLRDLGRALDAQRQWAMQHGKA